MLVNLSSVEHPTTLVFFYGNPYQQPEFQAYKTRDIDVFFCLGIGFCPWLVQCKNGIAKKDLQH